MNRFHLKIYWVLAILLIIFGSNVTVADGFRLAQNSERPNFRPGMMGKPGERFEKFRREKLMELLELNEDQKEQFLPMWQEWHRKLRDLRLQHKKEMNYLAHSLREQSLSEQQVDSLINQLMSLSDRRHQDRLLIIQKARDFLTPVQVGKLLVFEERFESHVMNKLRHGRGREGPMRNRPGEHRDRKGP